MLHLCHGIVDWSGGSMTKEELWMLDAIDFG